MVETPPDPETSHGSNWSRRDFLGGILRQPKEARQGMLKESGFARAFRAIHELVLGYRKLTQEIEETFENKVMFGGGSSELPRDLERQGRFWFGDMAEAPSVGSWDPKRMPGDLASDEADIREAAKVAAIRHGDASLLPALVPLLDHESLAVRSAVLEILASWRDSDTLPFLVRRLQEDPDAGMQVRAVLALKELSDDRVVEPLLGALRSPQKVVRVWASTALRERLSSVTDPAQRARVEAALTRDRPATPPGDPAERGS